MQRLPQERLNFVLLLESQLIRRQTVQGRDKLQTGKFKHLLFQGQHTDQWLFRVAIAALV